MLISCLFFPQQSYNFVGTSRNYGFIIEGGYALSVSIRPQGAKNEVLEVIRTGVSLMIAAMSADGVGVIGGVEQTGRGYEDIDGRLNALEVSTERQY